MSSIRERFREIRTYEHGELQQALMKVKNPVVVNALADASENLRDVILKNISSRRRSEIQEALENVNDIGDRSVRIAQLEILKALDPDSLPESSDKSREEMLTKQPDESGTTFEEAREKVEHLLTGSSSVEVKKSAILELCEVFPGETEDLKRLREWTEERLEEKSHEILLDHPEKYETFLEIFEKLGEKNPNLKEIRQKSESYQAASLIEKLLDSE